MQKTKIVPLLALIALAAPIAGAQQRDSLPFACGERLAFRIRSLKIGNVGKAVMAMSGPVDIRGTTAMLASFDASAGFAFVKGSDATRSWFDPEQMTSLRYEKRERRPFSTNNDSVEIFADRHHWDALGGESGSVESDHPLDELAFIYYLRTLNLQPDSLYSFDRHYDKRRAPNTVRIVGHERVTTSAGEFSTTQYEVTMSDSRDLQKRDVLTFWISDDHRRLPVRIESTMPVLGKTMMTLESVATPGCNFAANK